MNLSQHTLGKRVLANSCDVNHQLKVESDVYGHLTDRNKYLPLARCAQFIPGIGPHQRSSQGFERSYVDVNSELRNQRRTASKVPCEQYTPRYEPLKGKVFCVSCYSCNEGLPCGCNHCSMGHFEGPNTMFEKETDTFGCIIPESTKLDYHKPCNTAGICIDRMDPVICGDHQQMHRIHCNSYIGENTYLSAIDKYEKNCGAQKEKKGGW